MNIRWTIQARLIIAMLTLFPGSNVIAAPETNTGTVASDQQTQAKEPTVATGLNEVGGTKTPPKPVVKNKIASPENFIPTEGISQDLSVSFPVDI
jgi:hypothetical protein